MRVLVESEGGACDRCHSLFVDDVVRVAKHVAPEFESRTFYVALLSALLFKHTQTLRDRGRYLYRTVRVYDLPHVSVSVVFGASNAFQTATLRVQLPAAQWDVTLSSNERPLTCPRQYVLNVVKHAYGRGTPYYAVMYTPRGGSFVVPTALHALFCAGYGALQ